jgi:hypothetical protein
MLTLGDARGRDRWLADDGIILPDKVAPTPPYPAQSV